MKVKGFDFFQVAEDADRIPPPPRKVRNPEAESSTSVEETHKAATASQDQEREETHQGLARLVDFVKEKRRRQRSSRASSRKIEMILKSYLRHTSQTELRGLWIDQKI